jgi:hypothetical protein
LLGDKFADIEEKYDLSKGVEGFGVEGEAAATDDEDEFSDGAEETGAADGADEY